MLNSGGNTPVTRPESSSFPDARVLPDEPLVFPSVAGPKPPPPIPPAPSPEPTPPYCGGRTPFNGKCNDHNNAGEIECNKAYQTSNKAYCRWDANWLASCEEIGVCCDGDYPNCT